MTAGDVANRPMERGRWTYSKVDPLKHFTVELWLFATPLKLELVIRVTGYR